MDSCLRRNDGEMLTEELCEKESRGLPLYARNDINGFSLCAGMTEPRGYIMDFLPAQE